MNQVNVLDKEIHGYAPNQSPENRQRHKPLKRKSGEESRRVLTSMDETNPWESIVRRDPLIRMPVENEMARDGWDRGSNRPGQASENQSDFDRFLTAINQVPCQEPTK